MLDVSFSTENGGRTRSYVMESELVSTDVAVLQGNLFKET